MAYQISFDLEENATQEFLSKVSQELPVEPIVEEAESESSTAAVTGEAEKVSDKVLEINNGRKGHP